MLQVGEIAALLLVAANVLAPFLCEDLLSQDFANGGVFDLQFGAGATTRPECQQCGCLYVPSRHSAISFSSIAPAFTNRQSASVTSTVVAPWPLQSAAAEWSRNTYLECHGLDLPGPPALLHFARRIDVVAWNPSRVEP